MHDGDPGIAAYDDLDRHLAEAGSIDRAALPMGLYLAWCANHQLLSDALLEQAAALVLRVRFREATGGELAVAGCGGVLRPEHLSAEGRAFTEFYYSDYLDDLRGTFGEPVYELQDDWDHYDRIAEVLTRRLMVFRKAGQTEQGDRRWWKFWR